MNMRVILLFFCLLAVGFGQTVTNGGMETNVFNRNTNERVYTEYYDDEQIKICEERSAARATFMHTRPTT